MPWLEVTRQLPYARDPDTPGAGTSRDAAVAVADHAGSLRAQYWRWLTARGAFGGTDLEAAAALGCERSTINARRSELGDDVIYAGVTRSRIVRGRESPSKVWRVA